MCHATDTCKAVNFMAVLLFVPETRYNREVTTSKESGSTSGSSSEELDAEKSALAGAKPIQRTPDDSIPQVPKKSFIQELNLWSGTSSTNLFKMFVR